MSHNNYSLKYRTFDQLFEDVTVDMKKYALEGKIEPQTLLKVARKCNYELGFRIYRTRQVVLDVEHYKVRLPDDFHILNFALVCGEYEVTEALPQGTNIEERLVAPKYCPEPGQPITCEEPTDPCETPDPCSGTCLTKCGDEYQLVQTIHTITRSYSTFFKLYIEETDNVECECPNVKWRTAANQATIENGFLKTNFETGKVYLNYQGDMIDNNGNILVPDHEYINEFYEYSLKKRILENLLGDGEEINPNYHTLILQEWKAARNNAMSIVNTPNYGELKKLWQINRKAQYHKYFNMFKSWHPYTTKPYGNMPMGYNGQSI